MYMYTWLHVTSQHIYNVYVPIHTDVHVYMYIITDCCLAVDCACSCCCRLSLSCSCSVACSFNWIGEIYINAGKTFVTSINSKCNVRIYMYHNEILVHNDIHTWDPYTCNMYRHIGSNVYAGFNYNGLLLNSLSWPVYQFEMLWLLALIICVIWPSYLSSLVGKRTSVLWDPTQVFALGELCCLALHLME